jgi:murein DD-endopeptidase MepM/ murein hydrolase activator NlpD
VIGASRRWRLLGAAFACAATFAVAVVAAAPAQDLHSQLRQKQDKLSQTRDQEGVLSTTIQRTNAELARLKSQVASMQTQIEIARVQLQRVKAQLARDKARLVVLKGRLRRAQDVLAKRLVAIYKSGRPDAMTVILSAHGFDDLLTRYDYLKRIQQQDTDLVAGVRDLRDEQANTVERVTKERDDISDRKASLEASERELSARQSQLAVAQSNHQDMLQRIKVHETDLEGDVSAIQGQIAAQIAAAQQAQATSSAPTLPAAPPGQASTQGYIWPVNGPVTSPFCEPRPWESCHPGIDIAVPSGTPIRAAAAGTVMFTTPEASSGGYGNYTCIDHGGSISTCYAHQSSFAVSPGDRVSQGQVIGYTDCTGLCFGPHLHFEVRINGQVTDPMAYLP